MLSFDAVAVVENIGPVVPYVTQVEFSAAYLLASLYAIDDHTCHFADSALGKLLHNGLHISVATFVIAVVELAQATVKLDLVAVGTSWKTCV